MESIRTAARARRKRVLGDGVGRHSNIPAAEGQTFIEQADAGSDVRYLSGVPGAQTETPCFVAIIEVVPEIRTRRKITILRQVGPDGGIGRRTSFRY